MATKKKSTWVKSIFSELEMDNSGEPSPKKLRSSVSAKPSTSRQTQNSTISQRSTRYNSSSVAKPSTSSSSSSNETLQSAYQSLKITDKNVESSDWIENFAPLTADDLAIHPKKLEELHNWFSHVESIRKKHPAQICLITGPAGSGKTASVKVVAKQMKFDVVEWINPVDQEISTRLGDQDLDGNRFMESHVDLFRRFLFRSSRYKSIFETTTKRLILAEDFPNAFIRNSDGFTEILKDFKKYGKSPLVFIVTDSKSKQLDISYKLFPDSVKETFTINHISYNGVAATLMKKALKRIQTLMSNGQFKVIYKSPTVDIVDSIALAAQGDLRNAVINLHFGSLKGAPNLNLKKEESKSTSKKKGTQKKLSSIGKDESLTMMHALGRVFNPKYEEAKHAKTFVHSPEDITNCFSTEVKNFVNFVHANYIPHFRDIESVVAASDCLSISDVLITEYREDQIGVLGLNTAVRGVMVSNSAPVSGWMPVRGPKKMMLDKNVQGELRKLGLQTTISAGLLATDYRTYVKLIRGQRD